MDSSKLGMFALSLRTALPYTLSIFVGYVLMGGVFGMLLSQAGFGALWALGMSVFIYAGATQFACVGLLANGAGLFEAFVLAMMINARQIFYALSCLKLFAPYPKKKWYLAFTLTDETFALIHLKAKHTKIDKGYFMCAVAFLHHSYWILGCVGGAILGGYVSINMQGMGFVMNAIFIVLFIDVCKNTKRYKAPFMGVLVSFVCLLLFGKELFLLPALVLICALLFYDTMSKKPIQ